MLDMESLQGWVGQLQYPPLFVTVSGAHLYGFPSPDSDVDLRGCHRLSLEKVVGLDPPDHTYEHKVDHDGLEIELVTHDVGKYLRLLVRNNGYILEQIFSPLVVVGQAFLDELRPLARQCITRHHYHHYRGFLATQRKLLAKQGTKRLKTLLYAYRVALSGIHLLRTGEVEADLGRLAGVYGLDFLPELIAQKRAELAPALGLDWHTHEQRLNDLEARLLKEFEQSPLPEDRERGPINDFLVRVRLGEREASRGS